MEARIECPDCGTAYTPDTPLGLCPRCLLGRAVTPARGLVEPPDAGVLARVLPQFRIEALLGRGGMGFVYRAVRAQGGERVALKVLPPAPGRDESFVERFEREARALAELDHPRIVRVLDHGEREGYAWIAMELVEGDTLRERLRRREISPAEALRWIPELCDALSYAHGCGVVHRDLKPENLILARDGHLKIVDFGLAKLRSEPGGWDSLTGTAQVLGTWSYMAPEQRQTPAEVDHRADLFALGVVLYEILTGEVPQGRFDLPSVKSGVDARFDEVVVRALAPAAERRYQSAQQVRADLERIAQGPPRLADAGPGLALLIRASFAFVALLVAVGMALFAQGVALAFHGDPAAGGLLGGAFGCIVGGGGAFVGCWNSYRQMQGHLDVLRAPSWTWLDRLAMVYGGAGLLALLGGWWFAGGTEIGYVLVALGCIAVLQAGPYLGWRAARVWGRAALPT